MVFSTMNRMFKNLIVLSAAILLALSSNIFAQDLTPIDSLKMNDADGATTWDQAPSINLTGIVTSTLQTGTGTSGPYTVQNANTAIAVYGNFMNKAGVQIGDSVVITDVMVKNYSGLTECSYNSGSAVQIISSGHNIAPVEIKLADFKQGWNGFEKYESMFVSVKNVTFTDTNKTFSLNGKTAWSYHITDGVDTVQFRITKNSTGLIDQPIPQTPINVSGIVSQYDSSAPHDSGYEIFPLGASSISPATAIADEPKVDFSYALFQNYPNPFNPTTNISFSVPSAQRVELAVYDVMGRKVSTLYDKTAPAGLTNVTFNASDLSSGVYFYSIKTADRTISKKLILMK